MTKYFGPTKYLREKFSGTRRHDDMVAQGPRGLRWNYKDRRTELSRLILMLPFCS